MRFCGECGNLDRRKNPPCKLGYECKPSDKTVEYIRPSKCRKKALPAAKARAKATKNAKNRAIDAFQMWVRYRDGWTCVVCGKHVDPNAEGAKQLMHAGHYISRKYKSLLLDPKNCNCQCAVCNGKQNWEGMDPRYTKYMVQQYGPEIFEYLFKKQHEICKMSAYDWEEQAQTWEEALAEIKKTLDNKEKV